jgi:PAS domain S-box-containing protein
MIKLNSTALPPLVAVAVREAGLAERLARELRSRMSGVDVSAFVGESLLREAIAPNRGRSIDILVVDPPMAHIAARLLGEDLGPIVAVLVGDKPDGALLELASTRGYMVLRPGAEPRPFADPAIWISGAAAVIARRLSESAKAIEYGHRYEDLVHALPDIVYELDPEGIITFINESVTILGYDPVDLIGKHFSIMLHDDEAAVVDRDKVLPDYAGSRTGLAYSPKLFNERRTIERRTADLEVRLKKKKGATGSAREMIGSVISYGEVSSAGEYARDAPGVFKGSVGIIRDVTLRRKSEEMLRKLYQAVDQLGSCVFMLDHLFRVEYVNPVFFQLTGFRPPEVIGARVFRFFDLSPEYADRIEGSVRDGLEIHEEIMIRLAQGGVCKANFSITPVRSPAGIVTHAIMIVEDAGSKSLMDTFASHAQHDA